MLASNNYSKYTQNFNFNSATMLAYIHNKNLRNILKPVTSQFCHLLILAPDNITCLLS